MEPENPALDDYVRSLAPAREPRICLLPDRRRRRRGPDPALPRARSATQLCEPTHISLFRLGTNPVPLREQLLAQDVIYVGGGSMINLMALWRAHGLDEILREAWQAGIVLAGLSAGSMCWFEWGVTRSFGSPSLTRGLGFLPGSNSVHYDGEPERRPCYLDAVASGAVPAGWGVDDGVGLLFRGPAPDRGRRVAPGRAGVPRARGRRRGGRGGDRAAAAQGAAARATRAPRRRSTSCARCAPRGAAGGGVESGCALGRGAFNRLSRAARPCAGTARRRSPGPDRRPRRRGSSGSWRWS